MDEMKKYIIEFSEEEDPHTIRLMKIKNGNDGLPVMEFKTVTPYAEDSAYAHGYTEAESKYREIRDELEKQAYQRGYKEAYDTAYADAEEIYESGKRAMYQKGLKDAWECARKICLEEDDGGIPASVINDIFNVRYYRYALRDFSASEAIEKIRQYEQEQEKIKVGDEVENTQTGEKFIVTHLWENNRGEQGVSGFNQECSAYSTTLSLVVKTGRTFPEIASVLEKMRGE